MKFPTLKHVNDLRIKISQGKNTVCTQIFKVHNFHSWAINFQDFCNFIFKDCVPFKNISGFNFQGCLIASWTTYLCIVKGIVYSVLGLANNSLVCIMCLLSLISASSDHSSYFPELVLASRLQKLCTSKFVHIRYCMQVIVVSKFLMVYCPTTMYISLSMVLILHCAYSGMFLKWKI